MPEKEEEILSFKARTHHGSGQKERYDLKACVYLEDARVREDRGPELPRGMKLSLLRWDSPENAPTTSQFLAKEEGYVGGGDADARGDGEPHAEHLETEEAEGSAGSSCSELDRFPGSPKTVMREEMWMLCNLDDNLLFSQFRLPAAAPEPTPSSQPHTAASSAASSLNPKVANGPSSSATKRVSRARDPEPAVSTSSSVGADPHRPVAKGKYVKHGPSPALGTAGQPQPQPRQTSQSPEPVPVKQSRRDERVTFYARPTCHEFLGGWARGRAGAGVGADLSEWMESGSGSDHDCTETTGDLQRSMSYFSSSTREGAEVATGARVVRRGSHTSSSGRVQGGPSTRREGERAPGPSAAYGGTEVGGQDKVDEKGVSRVLAIGFHSGECAVMDATVMNSPSIISVLNKGGAYCEGRVTAVRFVPRAGRRLLVAAFSTGDVYTLDLALDKEHPLGPAAERAAILAANGTSSGAGVGAAGSSHGSGNTGSGGTGTGVSSRSSSRRGSHVRMTSSASTHGRVVKDGGGGTGSKLSSPVPSAGGSSGANGGSGHDRSFFVEANTVRGANPVSRWRVTSDGREITEMMFAPCEVDGRRLLALGALDGALRVVDYDEQALLAGFRSWFGGVLCLDWSPDGRYIVTGGEDDAVTLWCLETRTCVLRGEGHGSWVTGVAFDNWTSRQPYYRFTSVGEDARLCMWEHDELGGSLLRGGGARRLRRTPSSNLQRRYRSSEKLTEKDPEKDADKRDVGEARSTAGTTAQEAESMEQIFARDGEVRTSTWPIGVEGASRAVATMDSATGVAEGAGAGRKSTSVAKGGVSFVTGSGRREHVKTFAGRGVAGWGIGGDRKGRHSANGGVNALMVVPGELDEMGDTVFEIVDAALVTPPLRRREVAKAEPLCCKQLALQPLSQVAIVRGGIITLCTEGLLKMWSRPNVPPPLPPLTVDMQHKRAALFASRGKDDDGYAISTEEHREEADSASPPAKPLRRGPNAKNSTLTGVDPVATGVGGSGTGGSLPPPLSVSALPATSAFNAGDPKGKGKGGMTLDPALHTLINTDILTPRGEGGSGGGVSGTGGDGSTANGGPGGGKRRGFSVKRFFGTEKSANGRTGSHQGVSGVGRVDDGASSALANANSKAREPVELKSGSQNQAAPKAKEGSAGPGKAGQTGVADSAHRAGSKRESNGPELSTSGNRLGRSSHVTSGGRAAKGEHSGSGSGSGSGYGSSKDRHGGFHGRGGASVLFPAVGHVQ